MRYIKTTPLGIIGVIIFFAFITSCDIFNNSKPINHNTQNLIIITIDGLRWQEVFTGADSALIFNERYVKEDQATLNNKYWATTPAERRIKLMPFFWSQLSNEGKLYGNRNIGNKVTIKNDYWYSYPGYNEIFTGYPDKNIRNNDLIDNKNKNVLEFINEHSHFNGDVYGFTQWMAFDYILNTKRNNLNIFAGTINHKIAADNLVENIFHEALAGTDSLSLYRFNHERFTNEVFMYAVSKAYLSTHKPKVLYISFNGTDHFAHHRRYDLYLNTAFNIDTYIKEIWNYVQSDTFYSNKTTLFITTDHGRGLNDEWYNHGHDFKHSNETWFAVIGPDTKPLGEIATDKEFFNYQFAQSFANFLGINFVATHPIGNSIKELMDN